MTIPPGPHALSKTHVYQLRKSKHGLKVTPKRLFEKFRGAFVKLDSKPHVHKSCIFEWQRTNSQGGYKIGNPSFIIIPMAH